MRQFVERAYKILVIIMALMCLYALVTFRVNQVYTKQFTTSFSVEPMLHSTANDERSVTGEVDKYLIHLGNIELDYNKLYVYTADQDLDVYVGGELIYSMAVAKGNFADSPGRIWNKIVIQPQMSNTNLELICIPRGQNAQNVAPDIYFGEEYEIVSEIFKKDVLSLAFCSLILIAGIVIVVIELVRYKRGTFKEDMFFAGVLVLLVSIWKIAQSPVMALYTGSVPALTQVPYLCMLLIGIPFLFSMKAFLNGHGTKWYVLSYMNFIVSALCVVLYLAKIMSFRKTQSICIIVLLLIAVVSTVDILHYRKNHGVSEEYKLAIAELLAATVWFVCDAAVYIATGAKRTSSVGAVALTIFMLLVVKYNMDKAGILMEVGSSARNFEKIAYKDVLTNFFNRAAYADYVEGEFFKAAANGVLVFDLNDLKKCNDTLGHAKGDQYIKDSAAIVASCFGDLGQCYRLGGDEFSVIFPVSVLPMIPERKQEMMQMVAEYNAQSPDIHMGIACGYAAFDGESDESFAETAKRADQMMYQEKYRMKHTS